MVLCILYQTFMPKLHTVKSQYKDCNVTKFLLRKLYKFKLK